MSRRTQLVAAAALACAALATIGPFAVPAASAVNDLERADMTVTPVLTGLDSGGFAVAARFAPDGRIYVAFKEGVVRMYDAPGDTTAVTTLDIRQDVHDFHDRGLLGLALDPQFDSGRPYIYVLYTYDFDPFSTTFPRWGDTCPTPPGETADGCVVSARLARYTVGAGGVADPASVKLLLDGSRLDTGGGWCNQFPSHSIGTVSFAADGMLYVGSGDGASYTGADYGQRGGSLAGTPTPKNPCDDRDDAGNGRGDTLAPASSRGGALRAQSVRNPAPGYQSWDGAILRIDPDTGAAPVDNPLVGGTPNDDRIVAYGLRNPYRFTVRPGTDDLYIGDVGWTLWEEIDTFTSGPDQSSVPNLSLIHI